MLPFLAAGTESLEPPKLLLHIIEVAWISPSHASALLLTCVPLACKVQGGGC